MGLLAVDRHCEEAEREGGRREGERQAGLEVGLRATGPARGEGRLKLTPRAWVGWGSMEGTKCGVLNHKWRGPPASLSPSTSAFDVKAVDKQADRQHCSVSISAGTAGRQARIASERGSWCGARRLH